jgi:hypothetical protein|tara:strand:+ start:332 stop:523 length:192 start_codon:yes stop_codon:yes gene_type:complete
MTKQYLDYLGCYEDTLLCLKKRVITEKEIPILIEQYESEEHYECCGAILNALEDYKNHRNYLS